ncbi:ATP-binding protein [Rhizobium laguerreae]
MEEELSFRVVPPDDPAKGIDEIILIADRWNDWFKWVTQFYLVVRRPDGSRLDVGQVKIGKKGMTEESGAVQLPGQFSSLDDDYFSVGQSENYYETISGLGDDMRVRVLSALKDCAFSTERFDRFSSEPVMNSSLMRDIDIGRLRSRLHHLANGTAALTQYKFSYQLPVDDPRDPPPVMEFDVYPESTPPTNVHVLIGRNGVGKTRLFDLLARSFLGIPGRDGTSTGEFTNRSQPRFLKSAQHGFAGLVTVSFSIFDSNGPLVPPSGTVNYRYSYIGLLRFPTKEELEAAKTSDVKLGVTQSSGSNYVIKTTAELADEFVASVAECREGARRMRWAKALKTLEADPLFAEVNISHFAELDDDQWQAAAWKTFLGLSSGHSVVLLAISRLVVVVEEQSLVLLDEPEAHLHPPLISAFIRALSDLLTNRNGVAIVATHSPVVLQEVPASCVWVVNRSGRSVRADRPEIETFGENVGVLTREVFNLEVVNSGFHRMVTDAVAQGRSYDEIIALFQNQLGAEGRTLARALTSLDRIN